MEGFLVLRGEGALKEEGRDRKCVMKNELNASDALFMNVLFTVQVKNRRPGSK